MKKAKVFAPTRMQGLKKFDPNRDKNQALYKSKDWTDYRFRFLHHNPKCYACGNDSRVVDHVQAHKGNEKLFEQNDNHIPLCTPCHSTATQLFDKYDPPKTQEKILWLTRQRDLHFNRTKVKVIPYRK